MSADLMLRAGSREWADKFSDMFSGDEYPRWWEHPEFRQLFFVPFICVGEGSWLGAAWGERNCLPEPVGRVGDLLGECQPRRIDRKLITQVMVAMNVKNTARDYYFVASRPKVKRWLTANLGSYVVALVE